MTYEEKLVRYIASKMIQKKFFGKKHRLPSAGELDTYINRVLSDIKDEYKQFSLIRRHSKNGLLTPLIRVFIDEMVI